MFPAANLGHSSVRLQHCFSYAWHAASLQVESCRVNLQEGGAGTNSPQPANLCCEPQVAGEAAGQTCLTVVDDFAGCAPLEPCSPSPGSAPLVSGFSPTSHLNHKTNTLKMSIKCQENQIQ